MPANDERHIEVLASGLPGFAAQQLAVDATLCSALRADGSSRPRAHWQNGAALLDARDNKEDTYPELANGQRCRLVVLGIETGGRLSQEAVEFFQLLAKARARRAVRPLRQSAEYALYRRWTKLFAVTAASAFAASLVEDHNHFRHASAPDGFLPWLPDLLSAARHDIPVIPSCLPLRG